VLLLLYLAVDRAPKGKPMLVRTHDFKDKDLGHAIPYGVLDLTHPAVLELEDQTGGIILKALTRSLRGGAVAAFSSAVIVALLLAVSVRAGH
jgi:hypothetical protein